MAKRSLSWSRSSVIAWRDLKSSPAKFIFVVLSVAIGVAALVGIRGFSTSFRQTLSTEARSLMAGDLTARIFRAPTDDEEKKLSALTQQGIQTTWSTETIAMATSNAQPMPLLVALKAVDPSRYPFYGHAVIEPQQPLPQALNGDTALVAEEFLVRTNAHVGDKIQLGGQAFLITGVLRVEPDRISSGASLGPRVLVSNDSLKKAALIGYGSRAAHRLLIKIPATMDPAQTRKQIEAILTDAQVTDYREGNPGLTEGLDHATAMLSLICLVAMVLGAIGVAMSMHAHIEQRMEILAILKSMGASTTDIVHIYLLQTFALGLAGALLGAIGGLGVLYLLPIVFGHLIPIHTSIVFPWSAILAGVATGILTTLLFCLPPLLEVRNIRPILVLRRLVEGARGKFFERWVSRWPQLLFSLIVVFALGLIARALSESTQIAGVFLFVLVAALVVLLFVAWLTLRTLRLLLNRIRLRLPSSLRQGLANLYRPGNQSAAVLAALGTGILLILSVYLFQSGILNDLRATASPNLPNIFLIDIGPEEVSGVREFFEKQPGVSQQLELLPVTVGRITALNGQSVDQLTPEQLKEQHFPRRLLQTAEFSWSDALPAGDKLTAGKWWTNSNDQSIALAKGIAERLKLFVGSTLTIEAGDSTRTLKVAAIYESDGEHLSSRVNFMLPSALLDHPRAIWYGGLHMDPKQIANMERSFFAAYPTITVINLADVLSRIGEIVEQIAFVIRFLAGFSIFAGLMILASSISSTRYKRMREAVILKTLGASRMHIVRVFTVEFSVLGFLAGVVGVAFANLLIYLLLHQAKIPFAWDPEATFITVGLSALLAVLTGWFTSYRLLGLRPLEILREE